MSSRKNRYSSTDDSESTLTRGIRSIGSSVRSVNNGVASLIGHEETDPDPQAFSRGSTDIYSANVDINRPDPDTENYWEEYEKNPIISTQLQNLSSEVFEAGWWVTADSEDTREEITEFCRNMTVIGGQTHVPFSQLGEMAVVQYEARGTFLGEKMTDEQDRHTGINPVNPTTVEMYTKEGVNILVPPDHETESGNKTKQTADGEAAAYVQFDNQFGRWGDRDERRFARNQMLHWAREPDIGDLRGNSCIAPVYERSRALREKLQDNDLAIAMKAWPMILFQMGSPEYPWTRDEQEDFMQDYSEKELGPGMFQGVPGDVEVHEFAGETADIMSHVQTDVDMIVSGMPGPKYALGSFMADGDGAMNESHERQYRKKVRTLRLELEEMFTPYLREVAESWGYDPSELELHIGRPDGEVAPEDIQGSVIRYQSDSDEDEDDPALPEPADGPDGSEDDEEPSSDEESRGAPTSTNGVTEANGSQNSAQSVTNDSDTRCSMAELADPNNTIRTTDTAAVLSSDLIGTNGIEDVLGEALASVFIDARDSTLEILELRHSSRSTPDPDSIAAEFESQVGQASRSERIADDVADACDDLKQHTLDELDGDLVTASPDVAHSSLISSTREKLVSDIRSLGEEMGRAMSNQVREINGSDRDLDAIEERITGLYSDAKLENRGRIIAHMRLQELLNRIKLHEYRDSDDVDGVTVLTAECSPDTNRLTADLAGCDGDRAVAEFESEAEMPISEQLSNEISTEPRAEFSPLSGVPPYSFGSRAEIGPVTEDDE